MTTMVGTGVFVTGGYVLADVQSGSASLLLWSLGGLGALCGGLTYAELAAALPKNGGEYMLLGRIYHPAVGFTAALASLVVGYGVPVSICAMAFSEYMHPIWPSVSMKGMALGLTLVMSFVHCLEVSTAARLQNATTLPKLLVLVGLVIVGIGFGAESPVQGKPLEEVYRSPSFAFALAYVGYAYAGWNASVYIAGEVHDPQRVLPRSIIVGTIAVIGLYVGLNAAFQMLAPVEVLAGTPNVAYVAASHQFGDMAGTVVSAVIGFGLVSAVGALMMAGPRVTAAVGEDYPRLRWLAYRSSGGAPIAAIGLHTCISVVTILFFDDVGVIVEYAGLTLSIIAMLAVGGVIVLRFREPDLERSYRVPGYPWVPLVSLGITGWMLVASIRYRPESLSVSLFTLGIGPIIWWICKTPGRSSSSRASSS